jgi:phage terminase large subunit-like protein
MFFQAVIMFSEWHADIAERFFSNLRHTKGAFHGQPFELLPWERKVIRDVYGTLREDGSRQYRYVYIEVPKKNGKSEIAAGAALFHLVADQEMEGEIYSCAADREQASLVFNVAKGMIEQSPALKRLCKIVASQKTILHKKTKSKYKAESAEAYTKHGVNLSACIFDELHAQPNRDLWDVMTFGAGGARRQPIWWIITTAGSDPDRVSVGWEQHEYAQRILAGDIIDPTWYPVIFSYEGDDIYNEANCWASNPSLGVTISLDSVREEAAKAQLDPANERLFRWLRLNQWVTTKLTSWLPIDLYNQTVGDWSRSDLLGLDCYIGMDLSSTTDLTALAVIFPPQGKQLEWRVIWDTFIPSESLAERVRNDHVPYDHWAKANMLTITEGNVVDYTRVKERILEIKKFHKVIEVCADRAFAAMLVQELEQEGLRCVDIPQTYVSMSNPLNEIERLLKAGQMTHEANSVARWCFGNASIAKNGNEQIKLVKEHKGKSVVRTRRIDPISAWADAMARAVNYKGIIDFTEKILSPEWGM